MRTLVFATNNKNKIEEIREVIIGRFQILTLQEAGINIDIPEPYNTIEANASEKSRTIHKLLGQNCFSEDSGLETEALNGAPGVKSARYAGEKASDGENIAKLLYIMENYTNRTARFKTVISLIFNNKEFLFEGLCPGHIKYEQTGSGGFGYDSIFVPEGSTKTFAEMSMDEKNLFSHRKKAVVKLLNFLKANG
ncbi:MAG: RdgB/HAM1 family non-canonical purine NTP pyrophosphatase [Ferruginibacter sp.]